MDRLEHGREAALRIQIGGGGDAQAPGQRGGQIGEDVRVQVGGDDGVQGRRLEHHPGGHRVDQLAVGLHVGVVAGDLEEHLVPEHHPVPLRVRLGDQRELLPGPLARQLEGEAVDARHACAGEHRRLGRHFLRQPAVGAPAVAGVLALGVLAHHHPVNPLASAQGARHPRQHARRPDVGVLIEPLADGEPQAPQRDVVGHLLASHRPEEDGVEPAQLLEPALRDVVAALEVVIGAPGKALDVQPEAPLARRHLLQRAQSGRDDFHSDSVSGDGSYPVRAHGAAHPDKDAASGQAVRRMRPARRSRSGRRDPA